ncbi:hypothetical protein [Flavihumibacter petaseus]|uniref:Uncharacterized protein n=1 Tax=Flavihumibacter petaseus NBRC 106054 TaxID=1220578 RepID=A0A0E9N280_9BACT|nr:hypothetical protein [Flavihumibacter petaseus]GAO43934.1 hypothetical protein FPE01S_02_10400 [Flavihumibacter petaseus NBRC 106054]
MNTLKHPLKTTREVSVWQLTAKIVVLAGVLMAYSYCFLLTISSMLKLANG